MYVDQIEHRIEEHPHDVDEVPVEARHLDLRGAAAGEPAVIREVRHDPHQADADDQVDGVQARHEEVEDEEHLVTAGVEVLPARDLPSLGLPWALVDLEVPAGDQVLVVFLGVLDRLDAEEAGPQGHGRHEVDDQLAVLAQLRRAHGQGHREAAAQQDDRVEEAQPDGHVARWPARTPAGEVAR